MEEKSKDFFWTSYVDLMTALFAVVLVLFVLSYYNLNKKKQELENLVRIKEQEAAILNKVKANFKLFESEPNIFYFDTKYNRIQLSFEIKFRKGLAYYTLTSNDIEGDFKGTKKKLDELGSKLKSIINEFQSQKKHDTLMKDISYLMVISGSASKFPTDSPNENYILSYKRALSLHEYWKKNLGLDFDAPKYHDIIELQISGVGFGGVGRFNSPYNSTKISEEEKNQRFIIHIAPKIGK
ncbi:hypothetical protein [Runella sp.]|uniref:hypothetical protein n=1 Tax=Runella sp. TaxID=1960881 RepID=UPI003D09DE37